MSKMESAFPVRKVTGAAIASAATSLILWGLDHYILDDPLPAVQAGAVLTIVTAVVGWLIPPGDWERIVHSAPAQTPGRAAQ